MTAYVPSLDEKDPRKVNLSIQQLAAGRSNAVGTVSLSTASSTTVTDMNCSSGSRVALTAGTTNAAAALSVLYVPSTGVLNGSFQIVHSGSTQADRTFGYVIQG